MFIHDIQQVNTLFKSLPGTFLGVGMTAFSRILPASFLENYHILALHKDGRPSPSTEENAGFLP